jgi:NADH-quinone oxidoreductase subunit L
MAGALLTSLYTFRLIFLVFYGPPKTHVSSLPGLAVRAPLVVLCVLSFAGGYVDTPPHFGGTPALSNFLNSTLPELEEVHVGPITEVITALCASLVFAAGLGLAFLLYYRRPAEAPSESALARFWRAGWGFDQLYNWVFVRPFVWVATANRDDAVDAIYGGIASAAQAFSRALRLTETGHLRWYASGLAFGSAVFLVFIWFSR